MLSPRATALVAAVGLVLVLAGLLLATTPWTELPGGHRTRPVVAGDFTPAEVAHEKAFHRAVRPPAYAGLALSLVVAGVLGLTSWGARLVDAVARPFGGRWLAAAVVGGVVAALVPRLITLPLDARAEVVLRRYGLSTQSWGSWAVDQLKAAGLAAVLLALTLGGLYAMARRWPDRWWVPAGIAAAVLTVVLSFVYPLVVEPVFNKFTPMADGPLRTSLLELAQHDGVPVKDVLVADASRRTTALNAYVSGLGSTRRIVVYDTLVQRATPDEVRLVVAHELGHVKAHDVRNGTVEGALGAVLGAVLLYLLLSLPWVQHRAGLSGPTDPRGVAFVLFAIAALSFVGGPVQNLVSRRVESRADLHALDLTRDAQTFAESERTLSLTNLSDLYPNPVLVALFASHPSTVDRIAMARDWARRENETVPGPLA